MTQSSKNYIDLDRYELSKMVTDQFLEAINAFVEGRHHKSIVNERELAQYLKINLTKFSQMRGAKNIFVTIEMVTKMVNDLGLNANTIFVLDKEEHKSEKLLRDNITINSSGSGVANNVVNSDGNKFINGPVINGNNTGTINNAEKIIQGLPASVRKELKAELAKIQTQNIAMSDEIEALKKSRDQFRKDLSKKEKELEEIRGKYISLLEKTSGNKK